MYWLIVILQTNVFINVILFSYENLVLSDSDIILDTGVTPHMFFYYKDTFNLLKVNVNK